MDTRSFYNGVWRRGLDRGKQDFGDVEQTLFFIQQFVPLNSKQSVLEVGSGTGHLCGELVSRNFSLLAGTDISSVALKEAKLTHPSVPFVQMDAENLAVSSNSIDICLSFDVAEHVQRIDDYFSEIYRVLKKDGLYALQTPNRIINTISETIRWKGFGWLPHHPSLQYSWTLKNKLYNAGFSKVDFYKLPPLSPHKLAKVPSWLASFLSILPWKQMPLFLQSHFWCVVRKG